MTTVVEAGRKRGFALGLVSLILAVIPIAFFAILLTVNVTDEGLENAIVDFAVFGVPVALFMSLVVGIVAIVLGRGRILGIVSVVVLVPEVLLLVFVVYALFFQARG